MGRGAQRGRFHSVTVWLRKCESGIFGLHVLNRFVIIVPVRDDIDKGSNYAAVTMKLKGMY
jgi:hypothetical protein